jgi:hypothetical protein
MFKMGILPSSGGWLDQASKFNDVMLYIEGQVKQHKIDNQKKAT